MTQLFPSDGVNVVIEKQNIRQYPLSYESLLSLPSNCSEFDSSLVLFRIVLWFVDQIWTAFSRWPVPDGSRFGWTFSWSYVKRLLSTPIWKWYLQLVTYVCIGLPFSTVADCISTIEVSLFLSAFAWLYLNILISACIMSSILHGLDLSFQSP